MRRTLLLALAAFSAVSQAIVVQVPFFNTAGNLIEGFDTIAPGSYFASSLFTPMSGTVYALNAPNMIDIAPPPFWQPPAFNAPNTMVGTGTDLGLRVIPPMRRLGAYFRSAPDIFGVAPTGAMLNFYDQSNTFLGSMTIPLSSNWTWEGFMTVPQLYTRVEIYGIGAVGGVEMDELRIRPF